EFQLLFGLSRMVPGMNLLSLTVLLGHRSHGIPGAILATGALTVPSFALTAPSCRLVRGSEPGSTLGGAARGLEPAAAALLAHTGWELCRGSMGKQKPISRALWMALLGGTAAVTLATTLHPAWVVLGSGLFGVLVARWGIGETSA